MRRALMFALVLFLLATPVLSGPALNYRGPRNETARGIAGPGEEGLLGTARLHSKSNRVEGDARWEFWWECNRDTYLRRALKTNERLRSGSGGDLFYSAEPKRERQVTAKSLDDRIRPLLLAKLSSPNAEELSGWPERAKGSPNSGTCWPGPAATIAGPPHWLSAFSATLSRCLS